MTDQSYRLSVGGRIDRARPLSFRFNGKRYSGYAGDTLASALLANGVHLLARSFKYHRPRGILSAGTEEPNALVQLETGAVTVPNVRASQIELYQNLHASSQNCWPGVGFDVGAVNNVLARLLPAGFYYKTFMWPGRFWHLYEHFIRKAAGLGRAPDGPDPDRYDKMHIHTDVLVVGAGPAGLAAALAAARSGARVILADEQGEPGGALLGQHARIDDKPAGEWIAAALAELAAMEDVYLLSRSTVVGYYDHNYLMIAERRSERPHSPPIGTRERLWKVRAKQVVLATGAHERPMVFRNNDLPGIMLASAAQTYVNRYAVRPGNRAVVFTNNDSAYRTALALMDAGVRVAAVVDARANTDPLLASEVRQRGIDILAAHAVVAAVGYQRVRSAQVMRLDPSGTTVAGPVRVLDCDLLCMSGGWNPAVHLFSQSRGRLRYDPAQACFVPGESVQAQCCVGAANGTFSLARCLAEGHEGGIRAAAQAGRQRKRGIGGSATAKSEPETPLRPLWLVPPADPRAPMNKHFVDFHNDVSVADIMLAAREGYRSVEHMKRYTTAGMGTDQGKTGNVNVLAILGQTLGTDPGTLGTTTFRPPYTPVSFGVIAGRDIGELADPARMTPMHSWHVASGAKFEDVGQWKRAWYYPRTGESMHEAVDRECLATRNAVGIFDASTLGKIDIQGPDTPELLNRVYINNWSNLALGRCRYGIMCGENGMVFDDGVTTRVGEHQYWMTTTTGNAARVLAWLEEWLQTEWPELKVYCNSMTEHWATVAIAGPFARELLAKLSNDIDLDPQAFPFMSYRAGTVAGLPATVFRISFTGELSYEINVPARYGLALWRALMVAGEEFGATPFGTEAMHVLRAEKGYIIAGQDTDSTTTPIDAGLAGLISAKKDFLGKRSLYRSDMQREGRKQLVGLLTLEPTEVLPEGSQIVANIRDRPPMDMIGHVTSSYYSANLKRSIALALVKDGQRHYGERVHVPLASKVVPVTISKPPFYDPQGTRLHV